MYQKITHPFVVSANTVHTAGDDRGSSQSKLVSFRIAADLVAICEALVIISTYFASAVLLPASGLWSDSASEASSRLSYVELLAAIMAYTYVSYRTKQYTTSVTLSPVLVSISASVLTWTAVFFGLFVSVFAVDSFDRRPDNWFPQWAILTAASLALTRAAAHYGMRYLLRHDLMRRRRLAIVGATDRAEMFLCDLRESGEARLFDFVGIFKDRSEAIAPDLDERETSSDLRELVRLSDRSGVDVIAVAVSTSDTLRIQRVRSALQALPVDFMIISEIDPAVGVLVDVLSCGKRSLYVVDRYPLREWNGFFKWLQDKVLAIVALILVWPVLMVLVIAIRLESPGPVLFRQKRFGINNQPITVFKFRTMYHNQCDPSGARRTIKGDPRVTKIGRLLRRSSLDELPQLFNVVLGEMSMVGPRAHPIEMKVQDQYYHEVVGAYSARHRVKPGITGLAQVNGLRGEVDTMEKAILRVKYDLEYIQRYSLWLDMKILLLTVTRSIISKNAY